MLSGKKVDILLILFFFVFSLWLFDKSFWYDSIGHQFRIARHQVGDFGLHLSLIRSFSLGDNFPPESPFYPGKPLPYHYYFDFLVGMLEKIGVRIDIAFNGLSILAFTLLLFLIYKLPQVIFFKSRALGILSVVLFIFHSNITFIDFLRKEGFSLETLKNLWLLPDYLNKGPFDGSIVSIFFTLNVFLNQRHLIMGLAISLTILLFLISRLLAQRKISTKYLVLLGLVIGFSSRVHTLTFLATLIVLLFLFVLFRRPRLIAPIFIPALLTFSPQLIGVLNQETSHPLFNPGFLATRPLTLTGFVQFWALNLGIAIFTIPLGFVRSSTKQKRIFLSILPLFVIGNLFQLSFRIDHNHSIFNFFLIFANFYAAFFLITLWQKELFKKLAFLILLFFMTASGVVDLMAIKNDFQLSLPDAPKNTFMRWIKANTKPHDIFLARQEILDPVTLSGRKNYFGHTYYLSVMGYNYQDRSNRARLYFEATSQEVLQMMKKDNIKYIVIPQKPIVDFTYKINKVFWDRSLKKAYKDENVIVYQL